MGARHLIFGIPVGGLFQVQSPPSVESDIYLQCVSFPVGNLAAVVVSIPISSVPAWSHTLFYSVHLFLLTNKKKKLWVFIGNLAAVITLSPIFCVREVTHLFTVCICFSSVVSYSHLPFYSCPRDFASATPLKVGERWRDLFRNPFFLIERKTETKKVFFLGSL